MFCFYPSIEFKTAKRALKNAPSFCYQHTNLYDQCTVGAKIALTSTLYTQQASCNLTVFTSLSSKIEANTPKLQIHCYADTFKICRLLYTVILEQSLSCSAYTSSNGIKGLVYQWFQIAGSNTLCYQVTPTHFLKKCNHIALANFF